MYLLNISIVKPVTGESRNLTFQFDQAGLCLQDWVDSFPLIQDKIDELTGADTEPPVLNSETMVAMAADIVSRRA